MDATALMSILRHLESTGFAEVAGARFFATVPVAQSLLNQVIREAMPPDRPVRDISIRPESGNRLAVRITPRAMFVPSITLNLSIERQPEIPTDPVLVLRLATMPGLLGLFGAALPLDRMLPPGVRMQGESILVDLREMARHRGFESQFGYLRQLRVTTDDGRIVVALEAGVG